MRWWRGTIECEVRDGLLEVWPVEHALLMQQAQAPHGRKLGARLLEQRPAPHATMHTPQ
jgi:hypothetical protein